MSPKPLSIYIHIPFCSQKCHYCDFYSISSLNNVNSYIDAVCSSIKNALVSGKSNYLVKTIYFGGGTPNYIALGKLQTILKTIYDHYQIADDVEITVEINPEFSQNKKDIQKLKKIGVNRLSIGVQSLQDKELHILGRIHHSGTAVNCIKNAKSIFDNLSLDLIYAITGQRLESLNKTLDQFLDLKPQHISCYNLTREEGTKLATMFDKGELEAASEDLEIKFFKHIHERLTMDGYEHYEISNYAKPGFRSRHNSNYWTNNDYLGIGPSAHSRIGNKRYAFHADLNEFISRPYPFHVEDDVTEADMLITRLRCSEGLDINSISTGLRNKLLDYTKKHPEWLILENHCIKCTLEGWLILDSILVDLL